MADKSTSELLMNNNFDLLENYVNKKISLAAFRRELVENGYSVKDITEIENFAAALQPTNWNDIIRLTNHVKNDYAAGKIDFYKTVNEYMEIYPKLSKEDAAELVKNYLNSLSIKEKTMPSYTENNEQVRKEFYVISYEHKDHVDDYKYLCAVEEFEHGKFSGNYLLTNYGNYNVHGIYDREDIAFGTLLKVENEIWRRYINDLPLEKIKDFIFKNSITDVASLNKSNDIREIKEKNMSDKSSMALSDIQSNWNVNNPNSPMKFGNLPYEIGSPEHRKNQLETLEKQSLGAAIRHGALKNTEFNNLTSAETGNSPPLERRNFNSKENFMSDEFEEQEEKDLDPKQLAFMNAAHQRKVVADAIKAGTLCCLPGADGYADTAPAVNIMSINKPYHGANLLFLKDHQKQNGFPTAEYITVYQIDNAKIYHPNLFIEKGQKSVSLHVSEKSEETGIWEEKHIRLFNVAQVNNPALLKKWAEQKREERAQEQLEYQQTQHGAGWKPPEPKAKGPVPEVIVCNSTEPEKYFGQYLAAVSMGSKFKASPEQAAEFSEKMVNSLYEQIKPKIDPETGELKSPPLNKETGEPLTDVFSLEKISRNANSVCKEFMRDLRMESQKQNQPEQKQEQEQSRGGRGM